MTARLEHPPSFPDARRYGAVGNGTNDDTDAIIAALVDVVLAGNGILYFPKGTYICTTITVPSSVCLVGAGYDTVLKLKNATNADLLAADGADNIAIRDLILDGNHAGQTGACSIIKFHECDDLRMDRVRAINGYGNVASTLGAVDIRDCARGVFTACDCLNAKYDGWMFYGATGGDHTVIGGNYSGCGYSGIGTVESPRVRLFGVIADSNGTSNITINGPDNEAHGCTGTNSVADHGINLGHDIAGCDASGGKVIGGRYSGNGVFGVCVGGGVTQTQERVQIIGVTSEDNTGNGVKLLGANRCTVRDLITRGNADHGLYVSGDDHRISGVSATGNVGSYGAYIVSGHRNILSDIYSPSGAGGAAQSVGIYDTATSTVINGVVGADDTLASTGGSTNPVDLKTITVAAGLLDRGGRLHIVASGTKTGAVGNKKVTLLFGGSTIVDYTVNDALAWIIEADIINAVAGTQRFHGRITSGAAITYVIADGCSVDTTADVDVVMRAQTSSAADDITCRTLDVSISGGTRV
jgi:hypothetical protein